MERRDAVGDALVVTSTHDVLVVDGGSMRVFFDEVALAESTAPPLYVTSVTTLEHPNTYADPILCSGPESIPVNLQRAPELDLGEEPLASGGPVNPGALLEVCPFYGTREILEYEFNSSN